MDYDIDLAKIFTVCEKDFLSVDDLKEMTGLADTRCIKLLRDIKGVSDIFGLKGRVHRVDYYKYIQYMASLSQRQRDGRIAQARPYQTRPYTKRKKAE